MVKSVPKPVGRIVASGMLRSGTPVEDYTEEYGLWVKREDLSCPAPGPAFSKARGVWAHLLKRPENIIGVLDTYHSQAGHAVARACQLLGKRCINFYPEFKGEPGHRLPQERAAALGAELIGLPAGRSAILYHRAKAHITGVGGYMMPNALKLDESVEETAKEVPDWKGVVIIPASSGTIAAGVIRGLKEQPKLYVVHLGYSRSGDAVKRYLMEKSGCGDLLIALRVVDEGYGYRDTAKDGPTPPWPCNEYYDLKTFRWYLANREMFAGEDVLFWNVG